MIWYFYLKKYRICRIFGNLVLCFASWNYYTSWTILCWFDAFSNYILHSSKKLLVKKKKQNPTRFPKSIIIYSKEIMVIFKGRSWKFKENSMHIVYLLYTYHSAESSRVIQKKYMKLPPLLRNICPIQGDKIVAVKVTVMFRMCTALPASLHIDVIIL